MVGGWGMISESCCRCSFDSETGILFQVVANAVAAIAEILETSPTAQQSLEMNMGTINKLLTALNECSEYVFPLISLFG